MYRCFLPDVGFFLDGEFKTMKEAEDHGRTKERPFLIYDKNTIVAVVGGSPISLHICNSEYFGKP